MPIISYTSRIRNLVVPGTLPAGTRKSNVTVSKLVKPVPSPNFSEALNAPSALKSIHAAMPLSVSYSPQVIDMV